ncbi:zinc ribbon domain-containing protein [Haloarcula pelagica]|uniref:zinc ribbon domain-containing protein n=1 Tax=Haloarcula pelagica TaxID=3033389 RepID=UPI0024C397F7|nr:zinc ribbon domain-containing protein [Halomicroarcula sp. YJ-61-S]
MSTPEDPRCPECGEPIGLTATYCMHCSADLTDEWEAADENDDGVWDQVQAGSADDAETATASTVAGEEAGDQVLDPDGLVDNTLTAVVGIAGGIVVGLVGTIVLGVATQSGWAIAFGLLAWLGSTAYLVRRRTVQGAVENSGYAVAVVLLLVPVVALSPLVAVDGGLAERGSLFLVLLLMAGVPAVIAAVVGWIAGRFVPEGAGTEG